jgi:hypothetical protein
MWRLLKVRKKKRRNKGHRVVEIKFDYKYNFKLFDEERLAHTFFPHKHAKNYRVAFMMIYLALKCNWKDDTTTHKLEDIRKEHAPEISNRVLMDTLKIMQKAGLILYKRQLFWQISNRFCKVLRKFAEELEIYNNYRETEIEVIDYKWSAFHLRKAFELIDKQSDREDYIEIIRKKACERRALLNRIKKQSAENRKRAKEEMKYKAKLSRKALEKMYVEMTKSENKNPA